MLSQRLVQLHVGPGIYDCDLARAHPDRLGDRPDAFAANAASDDLCAVDEASAAENRARLLLIRAPSDLSTPGTTFSRRLGINRRDDAYRRFDDLAGVEAEVLAKARRRDLHTGAQATVHADRHGERGKSQRRRNQPDPERVQYARLAFPWPPSSRHPPHELDADKRGIDAGVAEPQPDTDIYFAIDENADGDFQAAGGATLDVVAALFRGPGSPTHARQINLCRVYEGTLASVADAGVDLGAPFTRPEKHPDHRVWFAAVEVHRALTAARAKARKPPGPKPRKRWACAQASGGGIAEQMTQELKEGHLTGEERHPEEELMTPREHCRQQHLLPVSRRSLFHFEMQDGLI